jgi:ParB family chromosome partitioning protein
LARTDFRAAAARRLSEDRELSPAIVSLLSPEDAGRSQGVRVIPLDRIEPNPEQPRMEFDEAALQELAASIREHGVLQPILVRPTGPARYQLVAGERRWRASHVAGLTTIPALIDEIDDDLSPLDEAVMYDRMIHEHGYSVRRLAQKLGKDKGYLENRLRLADAPDEIKQLVSVRKDTLSHAYELLKVDDPKRRKRLADQVAKGELSLVKLRERIAGRPRRAVDEALPAEPAVAPDETGDPEASWAPVHESRPLNDDSLLAAKQSLADAIEGLVDVIRDQGVLEGIGEVDRSNLAKYLTIAKLRLENAIAAIRSGDAPET